MEKIHCYNGILPKGFRVKESGHKLFFERSRISMLIPEVNKPIYTFFICTPKYSYITKINSISILELYMKENIGIVNKQINLL